MTAFFIFYPFIKSFLLDYSFKVLLQPLLLLRYFYSSSLYKKINFLAKYQKTHLYLEYKSIGNIKKQEKRLL